jgi:hypothetical protein
LHEVHDFSDRGARGRIIRGQFFRNAGGRFLVLKIHSNITAFSLGIGIFQTFVLNLFPLGMLLQNKFFDVDVN